MTGRFFSKCLTLALLWASRAKLNCCLSCYTLLRMPVKLHRISTVQKNKNCSHWESCCDHPHLLHLQGALCTQLVNCIILNSWSILSLPCINTAGIFPEVRFTVPLVNITILIQQSKVHVGAVSLGVAEYRSALLNQDNRPHDSWYSGPPYYLVPINISYIQCNTLPLFPNQFVCQKSSFTIFTWLVIERNVLLGKNWLEHTVTSGLH